jgi:hypothetical protein
MSKKIKKLAGKTNRTILKLWSLILITALGVLGSLMGCRPFNPNDFLMYGTIPITDVKDLGIDINTIANNNKS